MKVLVTKIPAIKNECLFSRYTKSKYECILKDENDNYCELYNHNCPFLKEEEDE